MSLHYTNFFNDDKKESHPTKIFLIGKNPLKVLQDVNKKQEIERIRPYGVLQKFVTFPLDAKSQLGHRNPNEKNKTGRAALETRFLFDFFPNYFTGVLVEKLTLNFLGNNICLINN